MFKNLYLTLLVFSSLLFSGCMANLASSIGVDITSYEQSHKKFVAGEYRVSAETAIKDKSSKSGVDVSNLLPTLQAGNSYLFAKDYSSSLKMLDEAEDIIKEHHEKSLASNTSDYFTGVMLNDAARDYQASITESIMVNTYKSIDYMALGEFEKARVELNRAVDRQRRAKETYAELIAKEKDAIAKKKSEKKQPIDKTLNNSSVKSIIAQNYSSLEQFEAYPEFINPFTTYLAGLFFIIDGDYAKASSLLKEVHGMVPQNKTAESDFEMVEYALEGRAIKERYVWVIYENGLSPAKTEFSVNIPIFLASNKVIYTGIALPRLKRGSRATDAITLLSEGRVLAKTSVVADMESVIISEFNYSYNDILTRAILSAALKTYMQYEAKDDNPYLGLATAAFQLLTNRADIRSWRSLPKDFQVTRVKIPSSNKLQLKTGAHIIDVEIDKEAKHSIVYVKIPAATSKPSVSVIEF
ncbi:MAG: hypothetical protein WCY51_03055 [Sulfurimonas sp.]|uniref:COG3014 family protein n=1 Tax=Sulfurimonas sp. TaxID=2022749 RepID=UPI0025DA90CA|nr:hypothetical protein [Sulfurimonas sp.]MCK9454419.1 hypothetical protein [Sulfurimonas sp.]